LNGGAYAYLTRTYSPLFGFLYLWTLGVAVKPCGVSTISLVFSQYLNRVLFVKLQPAEETPLWANRVLAIACIWTVTFLQAWNSRAGVVIINLATVIKVTALAGIAFLGVVVLCTFPHLYRIFFLHSLVFDWNGLIERSWKGDGELF
jgi:amino acid transporter